MTLGQQQPLVGDGHPVKRDGFRLLRAAYANSLLWLLLACEARWIGVGRGFPVGQSLVLIGERV